MIRNFEYLTVFTSAPGVLPEQNDRYQIQPWKVNEIKAYKNSIYFYCGFPVFGSNSVFAVWKNYRHGTGKLLEKLPRHHMDQLSVQMWKANPFVIRQKKNQKTIRSAASVFKFEGWSKRTYIPNDHIRCCRIFATFELCSLVWSQH